MKRLATLVLTLTALLASSGCSVFGIATKGELEAAIEREAAQQRQVEARLAELDQELDASRSELAALDRRLRPRLASIDSALAANARQLESATRQWTAMQAALVSHVDSLRTEYLALDRDLAVVREGMTTVSVQASQAKVASRQALRLQYETLLEERGQLLEQLEALEQRLQAWPTPADSAAAPTDAVSAAMPTTGKVDIRVVTPERADGGGTLP